MIFYGLLRTNVNMLNNLFVNIKKYPEQRRLYMKKLLTMLLCLVMLVSLIACSGGGNGNSGDNPGGTTPPAPSSDSAYYPDKTVNGQNTFSLEKKSYGNGEAVLTLKVGGKLVKLAGFKLYITFDEKITVDSVAPTSDFGGLTENSDNKGKLILVFAGTQNIEEAVDICDIAITLNGATNLEFKVEPVKNSISYIADDKFPPTVNILGNGSTFKLA